MVTSLLPIYEACTQLLVCVQSSFCYYSKHPICIPNSSSSSKSKLVFSKCILYFPFFPSLKYPCYYLCCMCDEVDCMIAATLCSFWLLPKGNHGNLMKSLSNTPVSCMLLISSSFLYVVDQLCHYSETIFPQQLSTSPATSSSPVAFLSISFIAFTTSLHNI